jgi:hypothetical protein
MAVNVEKILRFVFGAVGFIIFAWVILSWFEVAGNNLKMGYEYCDWNFFIKMGQLADIIKG